METERVVAEANRKWYVMRLLSRTAYERISVMLDDNKMRYYQPKEKKMVTEKGRRVIKLVPVLTNLMFIYGEEKEIEPYTVEGTKCQFVFSKTSGKQHDCIIVPDKQMEDFIRVSSVYDKAVYLGENDVELQKGQKVRIIAGVFCGVEGVFVKVAGKRSKRLVVMAGGMCVSVEVGREDVEVI